MHFRIRLTLMVLVLARTGFGDNATPIPLRPSLQRLLEYYDAVFDPQQHMLRVESSNPGYHTKIATGTLVHPTRESLYYSHALLQRNAVGDAERASTILEKVVPLQGTDPKRSHFGVWPWVLEETLDEMSAPDLNWADFCGMQIAHMLIDHRGQLSTELIGGLEQSLRRAAEAIRRRDVQPGYTNIAVLGGGVCVLAGEILSDREMLEYGRDRLEAVVDHAKQQGGFNEYNSPPYAKVVIAETERIQQLAQDEAAVASAEAIWRRAWKTAAESFHVGTQQWAGPHSRNSRDRLRRTMVDFLSARVETQIESHPAVVDDQPRGYAVVRELPCPEEFRPAFCATRQDTYQLHQTFLRSRTKPEISGRTWFAPDACLGSVNQSSFWTQRKPVIGYWTTNEDPAVVFRARFLHDGRDFASMGLKSIQDGPRILCLLYPLSDQGDWHTSLDRPVDGVFNATDFRVRFELSGIGVQAAKLSSDRWALQAGTRRIVVHTIPGQFDGGEVRWELGRDGDSVFLDGVCYTGPNREFRFREPPSTTLVAAIELLRVGDAHATKLPFVVHQDSTTQVQWTIPNGHTLTTATP